jgi:hypothetical protein
MMWTWARVNNNHLFCLHGLICFCILYCYYVGKCKYNPLYKRRCPLCFCVHHGIVNCNPLLNNGVGRACLICRWLCIFYGKNFTYFCFSLSHCHILLILSRYYIYSYLYWTEIRGKIIRGVCYTIVSIQHWKLYAGLV